MNTGNNTDDSQQTTNVEFVGEPIIIPMLKPKAKKAPKNKAFLCALMLALTLILLGGFLDKIYLVCSSIAGIMFFLVISDSITDKNKNERPLKPFEKYTFLLFGFAQLIIALIMGVFYE